MPILKRRLDICGREKDWRYLIEAAGRQFEVTARQVGRSEPVFRCSCGVCIESPAEGGNELDGMFPVHLFSTPCTHIAEAQRDLSIARQAAAQKIP